MTITALKIIILLAITMLVLSPEILGRGFKNITAEEMEMLSRVKIIRLHTI